MKDILSWSGVILALALYIPLLIGIWRDKIRQSFATWFLWVALDVIALASIIVQKSENWKLLACYVAGGTTVAFSLVYKKQFKWTRFETSILFMAAVCMVIWYLSGPLWATVFSSLALCVAGIPQIVESHNEPDRETGYIYLGYALANFLSFLAGIEWTIADRFYYGCATVLCMVIAREALRKRAKIAVATGKEVVT